MITILKNDYFFYNPIYSLHRYLNMGIYISIKSILSDSDYMKNKKIVIGSAISFTAVI